MLSMGILFLSSPGMILAQECEAPPTNGEFGPEEGSYYKYRILSGFTGNEESGEESGIVEAFQAWEDATDATGQNVNFNRITSGVPDIWVDSSCNDCDPFSDPAGISFVRDSEGRPTTGTSIQVNKGPFVSGKIPVKKAVGHEIGHIFGLADDGDGDDESSIMNNFGGNNDATGKLPEEVTSCDAELAKQIWDNSQEPPEDPPGSPLVFDIDGGGIPTTHFNATPGVFFDIDGDGELERVGWLANPSGDAFLFLDKDGDGEVDGGSELFGDATTSPDGVLASNGWEALSVYDSPDFGGNGDRRIGPKDHVWASLRLWFDTNSNGLSEAGEIATLRDFKIVTISLKTARRAWVDPKGNIHSHQGRYFARNPRARGFRVKIGLVEDIWFLKR